MNTKDLTKGSILGNIMTFSLPYMLAYFLQILYGLADLYVIGQYCGVDSTTAVSNGAQVMHMVTVVLIGLAMGTTVLTARAVGANDNTKVRAIVGNTITMFAIVALLLMTVLLCLRGWIVDVMDTPAEAATGMKQYLTVCFVGIPFIVAYNIIASIFRGLGDSRSPMFFVAVACVVNIALDYLFIGYFGLGATGAALGTTLSQMASVLFAIVAIRRHRGMLDISRSDLRPRRDIFKNILNIGVPISMQDGFIQVSFLVITVIANQRGLIDAAAVGIVEKFIGLVFIVPSAMLSTVSAIAAQNIGAGDMLRAKRTMRTAMAITTGYGIVCAVVLQFVPQAAVGIFTENPQVLAQGGGLSPWLCLGLRLRRLAFLLQRLLHSVWLFHHIFCAQQCVNRLRPYSSGMAVVQLVSRHPLPDGTEHLCRLGIILPDMHRSLLLDDEKSIYQIGFRNQM